MPGLSVARRPLAAVALLVMTACGALLDPLVGTRLMDTSVVVLTAVAAGFAAGAWLRPVTASLGCALDAAVLTLVSQVTDPGAYAVADDLFFFAVLVGGPALGGAVVAARRDQVRELRRLSAVRAQQREAQVRAARLEELNRLDAGVVQALVQRMGALVVQAAGAAREPGTVETRTALDRMEETARQALDEMRGALGALRSPDPDEPEGAGEQEQADLLEVEAEPEATTRRTATGGPVRWTDIVVGCCGVPLAFEAVVAAAARGPVWANVLAGVAVGAPLVMRRRWPVASVAAVFAVGALMSALLTPLPLTVSSLLPMSLAAHAVGDHARGWWRAAGLGVVVVGVAATVLASPSGSADPDGVVPTLMWIGLAFAAGVLAAQHSGRATALEALLARIEAGRSHAVRLAVAQQRQHLARELHDSVAHAMTVVCLHAAAARSNRDEHVVRASLATIESTVRGAMDELRQGLAALDSGDSPVAGTSPAPATGATVTAGDLGREVGLLASTIGVRAVVDVTGARQGLDTTVVHVARRVVREALVNVARHAPTSDAGVRIVAEPTALFVEVTNEAAHGSSYGHGSGAGLRGLDELVRGHGGRLELGTPAAAQFRLAAYLPATAGVPA